MSDAPSRLRDALWVLKRRVLNSPRRLRPTSAPYVTGDDFQNLCDFVFDDDGLTFLPGDVHAGARVFVKAHPVLMDYFFRQIHPRIRYPYCLVSHNGDYGLPGKYEDRLADPKLQHWFSTNITTDCPKLTSIPIGILNRRGDDTNVAILSKIRAAKLQKTDLVYMNFLIGGDHERIGYKQQRQAVHERFSGAGWVSVEQRVSREAYLRHVASHHFVISPPGHGPDCFRHWEAMLLGTIPIVEHGTNMDRYADYPMLLVNDWSEVTPQRLEQAREEIRSRDFDSDRLLLTFWEEQVSSAVAGGMP